MNPRRNRLLSAIKSAQNHVQSSNISQLDDDVDSNKSSKIPKSKLARLSGKSVMPQKRKSLLSRVGVNNRPTFDLIADGVLGANSDDYQPKIKLNKGNDDISSLVAERIKNLRERTLSKISSDAHFAESSFFGFETDGTPIWSSVVRGARDIDSKIHHQNDDSSTIIHHHSTHLPVMIDWPKELQFSSHNTFKNWSTVSENKRATQLAEQVVDFTHQSLNPLIIIGESGTGKSHLLNAIGQAVMVRNDKSIFFIRGDELPQVLSQHNSWTDVFSNASMLLIDDIDASLNDDKISNSLGNMLDTALNMNVHVVVSSNSLPDEWPASNLWDLLRTGVKTILNRVGAGSLMLYARHLAMQKNLILTDEQLALIVTDGEVGWRSTKNGLDKVESAANNGIKLIDSVDIYKVMNDIQTDEEESTTEMQSESVEDIATRLINSVVDVVYSDQQLGGIELNTELPELSEDYQPPEFDIDSFNSSEKDFVQNHINSTLQDLTPEAPSVIDVDDRDKHLVAKMTRIIERDHSIAADILTDLDMGIDSKFANSDDMITAETDQLMNLKSKLLNLAERTSDASIEGLIGIADELRALEHELVAIDSERDELPEFVEDEIEDGLESYIPQNEWNIDGSQVSVNELIDDESMITPIEGVLEPHPEGVLQTSTITPVENVLSGEEE
ncbi:MAG TPA: AAA family ATPase [Candidatus Poseidoniales archaeon]|nr:MAG TPA: AAA family ATPase [Candidatus Poseidoniales archaeon]HII50422.1 ATP-binding protein [Candidatus Poseidoniaceae archaeon]|tara:strand:+ start:234 stop:2249 length:2016 start_codon:yes stop_codon:yes gene_type:complete